MAITFGLEGVSKRSMKPTTSGYTEGLTALQECRIGIYKGTSGGHIVKLWLTVDQWREGQLEVDTRGEAEASS